VLVLTRRLNESIQIGNNVKITVVELKNGAVKIGIETAPDVPILRTELISKFKFDINAQRAALSPTMKTTKPAT
jgi:carbon storage regulator